MNKGHEDYKQDWISVAYGNFGDGWDWDTFEGYYSPSARRYFWYEQGGCSCNWWEDPDSVDSWQNGDRAALIRAMRVTGFEAGFAAEDIQKVATFKETREVSV